MDYTANNRLAFIEGAIRVAARDGLEKATTKAIAAEARLNEAYIYRYFSNKDELLNQAYMLSSGSLINMIAADIERLRANRHAIPLEECARTIYKKMWRFLLDSPDLCRFHSYYYHSSYFERYAMEFHEAQVKLLVERLGGLFRSINDSRRCIYGIFSLIYDSAKRVVDGRISDDDDTANCVFADMLQYLLSQSGIQVSAE